MRFMRVAQPVAGMVISAVSAFVPIAARRRGGKRVIREDDFVDIPVGAVFLDLGTTVPVCRGLVSRRRGQWSYGDDIARIIGYDGRVLLLWSTAFSCCVPL